MGVGLEAEAVEFCEGAFLGFLRCDVVRDGEGKREVAERGEVRKKVEGLEDKTCGAAVSQAFGFGCG